MEEMNTFWGKREEKRVDYDAAILELLTRVFTLEQQVKKLTEKMGDGIPSATMLTYADLVENFATNPRDVHTNPPSRTPKWFFVFAEKGSLYVQSGHYHAPNNSNISGSRLLDSNEYNKVFALFQRRKKGENVFSELNALTQNGSYWFGVFYELNL